MNAARTPLATVAASAAAASAAPAAAAASAKPAAAAADRPPAWWRFPFVWMVFGGPALVVVASFITLTLAIRNPDPVLTAPAATSGAAMPAVQARNHAATPKP